MKLVALVPVLEAARFDLERAMERALSKGPMNPHDVVERFFLQVRLSAATHVQVPDTAVQHRP
jgi:hypothetical protein